MLQAALNAFKLPDLRRKLLFTLGVLVIYRFAASIPVPGIDRTAFNNLLSTYKIFQLLSLFSGGSGGFSRCRSDPPGGHVWTGRCVSHRHH